MTDAQNRLVRQRGGVYPAAGRFMMTPPHRGASDTQPAEGGRETSGAPAYDHAAFLGRLPGMEDVAAELVQIFLEDLPGQVDQLAAAIAAGDAPALRLVAHRIKGASASIGGVRLNQAAAAVEAAAAEGDLALSVLLVRRLSEECDELRSALREAWPAPAGVSEGT